MESPRIILPGDDGHHERFFPEPVLYPIPGGLSVRFVHLDRTGNRWSVVGLRFNHRRQPRDVVPGDPHEESREWRPIGKEARRARRLDFTDGEAHGMPGSAEELDEQLARARAVGRPRVHEAV